MESIWTEYVRYQLFNPGFALILQHNPLHAHRGQREQMSEQLVQALAVK